MIEYTGPVPRHLRVPIELDRQGLSHERLVGLFGMHMAFDRGDSERLHDAVVGFGHAIVRREYPALYARIDHDGAALDEAVCLADVYSNQLMSWLTCGWLAED